MVPDLKGEMLLEVQDPRREKKLNIWGEGRPVYHTLNTILRGFTRDRETRSTNRRYARQFLIVEGSPISSDLDEKKTTEYVITLSKNDVASIHPHDNDPMVITMRCDDWEIKRVLIGQESFADILYRDTFERLRLDMDDLKAFQSSLVGFLGEQA